MCWASSSRRLSLYPATWTETGSPRGATCSIEIFSPGRHPISMSFRNISWLSTSRITARWPGFSSDNFLLILDNGKSNIVFSPLFTNFENMASPTKSKVYFFYEVPVSLRDRMRLKSFIIRILKSRNRSLSYLNIIFCSDKRLAAVNRQFLNHGYYTDIITFELSGSGQPVEAEIYISVDRVRDNARHLGQTFTRELHRVIFHGVLHLCGLKDKTLREVKEIRAAEEEELGKYFR